MDDEEPGGCRTPWSRFGTARRRPASRAIRPSTRTLLLTDFPPEMAGCGAVILQSLLCPAELEKIVWLTAPYRF